MKGCGLMNAKDRRDALYKILIQETDPIKGINLAKKFRVSRQIIVQDIAILRASGKEIVATPAGYMVIKHEIIGLEKTIVSKHETIDELREELEIIVDHGGKILDVIVEHPIYGEIRASIMISNRIEIKNFIEKLIEAKAKPISKLTDGIHLHTIWIPNEEVFNEIQKKLKEKNYF